MNIGQDKNITKMDLIHFLNVIVMMNYQSFKELNWSFIGKSTQ